MTRRIYIFDTTLRDGEQAAGISLNTREKIEIAEQLTKLGVDVIEAGFPVASPGDFDSVKSIARAVKGVTISGLARANIKDIDWAWEAIMYSEQPRIHTFIGASPYHMEHQLNMKPEKVIETAVEAVAYSRKYVDNVEFSAMDATRADLKFLCNLYSKVIEAGASVINIPDTLGYSLPDEFRDLIRKLFEGIEGIEGVTVSVHCHNDLGLATANSIEAVLEGVNQVECTINGIGERAGNAALEEIVMALHTRKEYAGLVTGINTKELYQSSRLVSMFTGYTVPPNKAVVGENAFVHESGIHQDGMLKDRHTYEIMRAEDIGKEESEIYLGKHSGRHAFKVKMEELGFYLDDKGLERAFVRFKQLCDKKKEITGKDLEALALDEMRTLDELFVLEYMQSSSGMGAIPMAAVVLSREGKRYDATATGDGQVDAVCKAIQKAAKAKGKLLSYSVQAITKGLDSMGDVTIKLILENVELVGRGVSPDIIEASARAYLNAINRAIQMGVLDKKKKKAKKPEAKEQGTV